MNRISGLLCGFLLVVMPLLLRAQSVPQVTLLSTAQLWQRAEFRVVNVPVATNVYDPEVIRLDAVFTLPSARTLTVPAFWYQPYQRSLSGGSESLSTAGQAEWRVRFTPPEPGSYSVTVTIRTNERLYASTPTGTFAVVSNAPPARSGYVRIAPGGQYFETGDGQALRLIGQNVCWHGNRGTYDYDAWFQAMHAAGENFARLWMWPFAFGIEAEANSLTRYNQGRAWQLDYVLRLAEQQGIYLLLCLEYHGMFEVEPDAWNGNNYWPRNPYNVTNGGPCLNQNAFFTNTTAHKLYQKRLRYLMARYGYSPNVLAWEFFNEIDNVYRYLNATDVAQWHGIMGGWLHANDPYGHLVTTSLTGSSDRPELWNVSQLDFAAYHSYNEPAPARRFAQVSQSFLSRYRKPVMIGEFGIDWRGWNRASDPYLRGFRQGIWGGALGGSVGTGMSWWWESIHAENAYPVYAALGKILNRSGWGRGTWTNIGFQTSGSPPVTVGNPIAGGQPFDALFILGNGWGSKPSGQLAVANPASAGYASANLNSFVHGSAHTDLRVPFRLSVWVTNNARLVLHLNSVSGGATMVVRANTVELYRTNLPNLDGGWTVNNEYNLDIPVSLSPGKKTIEIVNPGVDWFYLDWVRLENVMPAAYLPDWTPSLDSIGLCGEYESLVYAVAPDLSFPSGATNSNPPLQQGQKIMLTNWPAGTFFAEWYDPATGTNIASTQGTTTNGSLTLPLPEFREDMAGIIYSHPKLSALGLSPASGFAFELKSETGGRYRIERSLDLTNWAGFLELTNHDGTAGLVAPADQPQAFFRATK